MPYAFNADMYCDDCGHDLCDIHSRNRESEDTDEYPQYVDDSENESDYPQHCAQCETFLENPLTDVGYDYVVDATVEAIRTMRISDALEEWIPFYDIDLASVIEYVRNEIAERKAKAEQG